MSRVTVRRKELEEAFLYTSAEGIGINRAWLCVATGKFHRHTGLRDNLGELPDDIDDESRYLQVPHKNELELGRRLVFRFVMDEAPELMAEVEDIFRRRGAYGRFKSLLDGKDLLQQWYAYEQRATRAALQEWCDDKDVGVED